MVRTRIIFCLIFFSISPRLFSMDGDRQLIKVTDGNCEKVVAIIDNAINQQYQQRNLLQSFLHPLTENDAFGIIAIATTAHSNPNKKLIDALYAKNNTLAQAIDFFSSLVRENLDGATCNNLNTFLNPNVPQPTAQFNKLSKEIREYVINHAVSTIEYEYQMTFDGHTDFIMCYDISPMAALAATGSRDNSFRIWSLSAGKQIFEVQENNVITNLCFNNDGSQIATLVDAENFSKNFSQIYNPAISIIKIWDSQSKNCLFAIEQKDDIMNMNYLHNTTQNRLAIIKRRRKDCKECIDLWEINKDNASQWGTFFARYDSHYDNRYMESYTTGNYSTTKSHKQLYITKKNCSALHLCLQAIKNTNTVESLQLTEQLKHYFQLTDYEIHLVQAEKNKKIDALKAISNKQK